MSLPDSKMVGLVSLSLVLSICLYSALVTPPCTTGSFPERLTCWGQSLGLAGKKVELLVQQQACVDQLIGGQDPTVCFAGIETSEHASWMCASLLSHLTRACFEEECFGEALREGWTLCTQIPAFVPDPATTALMESLGRILEDAHYNPVLRAQVRALLQ